MRLFVLNVSPDQQADATDAPLTMPTMNFGQAPSMRDPDAPLSVPAWDFPAAAATQPVANAADDAPLTMPKMF